VEFAALLLYQLFHQGRGVCAPTPLAHEGSKHAGVVRAGRHKGGQKLYEQLFSAIQLHDRLLLVLSANSIKSEWVMTEIRKAREIERKENRRKLFPIRLVNFDALRSWECFDADAGKDLAVEVREYFIPDFSNWKDHDAFEKAFARLQKDLKNETPPTRPAAA
jgi:hypothetical protein